jgi:hypothetical protein
VKFEQQGIETNRGEAVEVRQDPQDPGRGRRRREGEEYAHVFHLLQALAAGDNARGGPFGVKKREKFRNAGTHPTGLPSGGVSAALDVKLHSRRCVPFLW